MLSLDPPVLVFEKFVPKRTVPTTAFCTLKGRTAVPMVQAAGLMRSLAHKPTFLAAHCLEAARRLRISGAGTADAVPDELALDHSADPRALTPTMPLARGYGFCHKT